jgi:hypothetical protein
MRRVRIRSPHHSQSEDTRRVSSASRPCTTLRQSTRCACTDSPVRVCRQAAASLGLGIGTEEGWCERWERTADCSWEQLLAACGEPSESPPPPPAADDAPTAPALGLLGLREDSWPPTSPSAEDGHDPLEAVLESLQALDHEAAASRHSA